MPSERFSPTVFDRAPGLPTWQILGAALCVGLALALPLQFHPEDWAGWLLCYATPLVFFAVPEFRADKRLLRAALIVLIVHQIFSIFNIYFIPLPGSEYDPMQFHGNAVSAIQTGAPLTFSVGSKFFDEYIQWFYTQFGISLFLGQELSVLAFALSCVVLVRLNMLLNEGRYRVGILLLFGLLPAVLLFCSLLLREAWQILFFLSSAYWVLRLRQQPSLKSFLCVLFYSLGLAIWHNGLAPYSALLILVSVYWGLGSGAFARYRWLRPVSMLGALLLIFGLITFAGGAGSAVSQAIASGSLVEYAAKYRAGTPENYRANYSGELDISSPVGILTSVPWLFFQYMFAPFPWQIGNVLDIDALLENLLRLLLLVFAWRRWRAAKGEAHSTLTFLFLLYFSSELLWSVGTVNWGTAIRHHIVAYGLLSLIGVPGLFRSLRFSPPTSPLLEEAGEDRSPPAAKKEDLFP